MDKYESLLVRQKSNQKKTIEMKYNSELNRRHKITVNGSAFTPEVSNNEISIKVDQKSFSDIKEYVRWLHDQGKTTGKLINPDNGSVWTVPIEEYDKIIKNIRNIACVNWEKKQKLQSTIDVQTKIEDVFQITWESSV